ncbi:hypothetical protein DA075_35485 (plasmid) [Methylobacterium currus]|uniref:Uncharacterized protein n=1 Tax=Methylobacterium currus TaxID=2051553 RepID=A0A2R4WXB7_9HYPH|nr:hypothetical protein [Methylobacterium currus]AWB26176.1 hypothetical protein DA075_35485 [Methylobacterium currus]
MPTINLRNPFRRDGARPPLRQRAASLKAAAARAIRGETPPLGTADPALIALEAEFRAAAADYYAADTAIGVVHETYEEPPMPAALRVSRLDWIEHTIPEPTRRQPRAGACGSCRMAAARWRSCAGAGT